MGEYDLKSYHLFKMYYMIPDMTYDELSNVIGCDVKTKINKMKNWFKSNV